MYYCSLHACIFNHDNCAIWFSKRAFSYFCPFRGIENNINTPLLSNTTKRPPVYGKRIRFCVFHHTPSMYYLFPCLPRDAAYRKKHARISDFKRVTAVTSRFFICQLGRLHRFAEALARLNRFDKYIDGGRAFGSEQCFWATGWIGHNNNSVKKREMSGVRESNTYQDVKIAYTYRRCWKTSRQDFIFLLIDKALR